MQPLCITCAVVGAELSREQTPFLPITPEEIAREAASAHRAGACMVHLHGRDPQTGAPSQSSDIFSRILHELRQLDDQVISQVSTGGAVGMTVEERCGSLEVPESLRPQMATLSCGTVNFGDDVFMNPLPAIREIARRILSRGIKPEIEAFDAGHLDTAKHLASKGVLPQPLHVDFVLGVPGGMAATETNLRFLVDSLPEGWTWCVAGIGRNEFPMARLAVEWGGHVRVGLEDNIYLDRGVLAEGNAPLVARVVQMAEGAGRPLATVAEARAILRL